jgi:DNA-binding MarR family transcriptional regulator
VRELLHPRTHGQTGRFPVARWAAVRALWSDPGAVQVDIAAAASTSQSAVSQALADLVVRSPEELEQLYLDSYPGPKGEISYWRSEMPIDAKARRLAKLGLVISSDAAADVLAPWRLPTELIAYSAVSLTESEMLEAGFVDVDEARDANVVLITRPADTALIRQVAERDGVVLVHPLHVAYDLQRLGGEDRDEAAAVLLAQVRPSTVATRTG